METSTAPAIPPPPTSPGTYDPNAPSSRNTAGARNTGLFLQDAWTITPQWSVTAGVRGDRSRVDYDESIPGTTPIRRADVLGGVVPCRRDVSADRGRGSLCVLRRRLPASDSGTAVRFPRLRQQSGPLAGGCESLRDRREAPRAAPAALDVSLFWTDTDRTRSSSTRRPPLADPFGRNVNAGETNRRGVEVSARGRLARGLSGFANAAYTDASFTSGPNDGNQVPLVPQVRAAAGIDAALPMGFGIRADALYVGSQVLDNDPANAQPELEAYTVVNLRAGWERALGTSSRAGRLGFFVEARNLFDEQYATRGIYAFDFSVPPSGAFADFVTPAPGRRYLAGVTWRM